MVVISVMAVAIGTSSLVSTALAQTTNPKKVTICHIQPGNPDNRETITTGAPSVAAHVREHGDYIGACQPID
jgi:hypothetical protein